MLTYQYEPQNISIDFYWKGKYTYLVLHICSHDQFCNPHYIDTIKRDNRQSVCIILPLENYALSKKNNKSKWNTK